MREVLPFRGFSVNAVYRPRKDLLALHVTDCCKSSPARTHVHCPEETHPFIEQLLAGILQAFPALFDYSPILASTWSMRPTDLSSHTSSRGALIHASGPAGSAPPGGIKPAQSSRRIVLGSGWIACGEGNAGKKVHRLLVDRESVV